uniref:Uncharacterized protein n=1 Tax=Rhizophora mucronata TaxID=61149 RepID=A0A2P2PVN6_RHIMU
MITVVQLNKVKEYPYIPYQHMDNNLSSTHSELT